MVADIIKSWRILLYLSYLLYTSVANVMESLKQVLVDDWHNVAELQQFYDDLASNPYCTNEKNYCHIRIKSHAINHAYIQPNHPAICKWLAFDIDDTQALFAYYDNGLPPPQIIIKNPSNGHAHYLYRLKTPVGIGGKSSMKAVRYLASVQKALAEALGADKGYSGNLVKNPCHAEHETYLTGVQPSYTLAELANHLDLEPLYSQATQTPANDAGYGRNCALFEELRVNGYKCPIKNYSALVSHLKPLADVINNRFDVPLLYNEVMHIVRSIARYCSKTDFTESHIAFSERQRARIQVRWGDNTAKQEQAKILKSEGLSVRKIANQLNVGKSTVSRWLR